MNNKRFYITTTLPYVNAKPHIGHAVEFIRADILARHKRLLLGNEAVFFNTGVDEYGQKIADKAQQQGLKPQEYCDKIVKTFYQLNKELNISYDNFMRTTDVKHTKTAQKFWKQVQSNGYIEKRLYQAKYCIGCEAEKTDSELVDGFCPNHDGQELQIINEENYFFLASKFSDDLIKYYQTNPVLPDKRLNEIRNLIKTKGMKDFSISRLKEKMSWGIPVPNDDEQVMYVWFDALINYIDVLGWGSEDDSLFEKFWQAEESTIFQICGKDNLRAQTAMWQAMLFANNIKNSNVIYINGFINSDGKKMSKTIGNVVDPLKIIEKYGTDALRLFAVKHLHNFEDSDWTTERFHEAYTADLVNGLGNLTNRILAMSSKINVKLTDELKFDRSKSLLEKYDFNGETEIIWRSIADLDEMITTKEPFKMIKNNPDSVELKNIILTLLKSLSAIADWLKPIIPETSAKIFLAIQENKKPIEPLFPRIQ